jgi:hypothetical protein
MRLAWDERIMLLTRLLSRQCCGGPVLAMTLLCVGFGGLFLLLSAGLLGWVFIAVGAASLGLCLYLGYGRCRHRQLSRLLSG